MIDHVKAVFGVAVPYGTYVTNGAELLRPYGTRRLNLAVRQYGVKPPAFLSRGVSVSAFSLERLVTYQ